MMPYGDANAIVLDMAREVFPVVRKRRSWPASAAPILSGMMKLFLPEIVRAGFSGVQNFPTVGLIDGTFRQGLEETGMGYGLEIDLIAAAHRVWTCSPPPTCSIPSRPRP